MTMTDLDQRTADDGAMGPRSDNPRRRTFTGDYKLNVLTEYDTAPDGTTRSAWIHRIMIV